MFMLRTVCVSLSQLLASSSWRKSNSPIRPRYCTSQTHQHLVLEHNSGSCRTSLAHWRFEKCLFLERHLEFPIWKRETFPCQSFCRAVEYLFRMLKRRYKITSLQIVKKTVLNSEHGAPPSLGKSRHCVPWAESNAGRLARWLLPCRGSRPHVIWPDYSLTLQSVQPTTFKPKVRARQRRFTTMINFLGIIHRCTFNLKRRYKDWAVLM